jgi:hypothetical protein
LQQCNSTNDCGTALAVDPYNSFVPESAWCISAGASSVCQPVICYTDPALQFNLGLDSQDLLYKPCPGLSNSLCVPQYFNPVSGVLGFCQQVEPDAGSSTVGQACQSYASFQTPDLLCGADATCLGGVCQKICDAVGFDGGPGCPGSAACVSPQPVNLVAGNQLGGCGSTCDAFADSAHSTCATFCGGPISKCQWYEGDNTQGYCGAESNPAIEVGQPCGGGPFDPCTSGALCLGLADGGDSCAKLCSPTATASNSGDGCPDGQTCQLFTNYKNAGYCQ